MKNIDVHSHYLPESVIKELNGTVSEGKSEGLYRIEVLKKVIAPMPEGFFRHASRIREMNGLGIDHQVLSPTHHLFSYDLPSDQALRVCVLQNNGISEVCRNDPDHFSGNATLPLQDPEMSVGEIRRVSSDLEMSGVEFGTNIAGRNLDDESLYPVYEELQAQGMPIFVHPNDFMGRERLSRYYMGIVVGTIAETTVAVTSLIMGGVLKKFPKLRFIFCHGGGAIPYQISRIKQGMEVREENAGSMSFDRELLSHVLFDTVLFDGKAMNLLLDSWGRENVVFGTDYPFNMGNWESHKLLASSVSGNIDMILKGNAERLYGRL